MLRFSETEILRVWEAGVTQAPLERALTILAFAQQEESREDLAQLPIGRRDARLLRVREKNFGAWLKGFAECPSCRERLEFGFDLTTLLAVDHEEEHVPEQQFETAEHVVRFRLPTSVDLAALAACTETEAARRMLLARCVLSVCQKGDDAEIPSASLPEALTAALAVEMQARDPHAVVQFNLTCAACGQAWQSPFDVLTFLWAEIQAQARRLLREIHLLAWAYGWREAEILALSPRRRQAYLEMVS